MLIIALDHVNTHMDHGCMFHDAIIVIAVLDAFIFVLPHSSDDGVWRRGPVPGAGVAYPARWP